MSNIRKEITELLNWLRKEQGSESSIVAHRVNSIVSLNHVFLDALARSFTGKKDVCVAVCYDENERKIWVANNFRRTFYAEKYLNVLREYIASVEVKDWNQRKVKLEELLWLAIDNISEKNAIFTKDLNEKSEDSIEWTKLIKKLKAEKEEKKINLSEVLKKLSESASELLAKIKKTEEASRSVHYSNYLMPLYDLNLIIREIDSKHEETNRIIEAIKSGSDVKFISGSSSKCSKRVCQKCQWKKLKNQKKKTVSETVDEGAKVIECYCDKIDRDFRFCNDNECSVCLENSVHAEMKIINEFYRLNQKIEENLYIGTTKLCCFPCKETLEIIFEEVQGHGYCVCGTHGLVYANWITPNDIPDDKKNRD
jgi:hypothetical protein